MPTTPTRLPAKSTGSFGQRAVWNNCPLNVSCPGKRDVSGADSMPQQVTRKRASITWPLSVEMRALDRGVEFDVLAQVEAVGDVLQPTLNFRLSGEPFAPVPPLVQLLGEEVLVRRRFRIQASARIAVPIPGSTDVGPGLERLHRQSLAAQKMQLVKARDPGAYYDCVKLQRRLGIARCPFERSNVIHRLISLGFLSPVREQRDFCPAQGN